MQHPGSWYLPWGVPLQKMLVPFNHPTAVAAAAAYPQQPTTPGQCHQIQTQSVTSTGVNQQTAHQGQQLPSVTAASSVVNQHQQHHYQTAAAAAALANAQQQPTAAQNYAQIHSVTAAALQQHHTNQAAAAAALHHHNAALHQQHQAAPPTVTGHGHAHNHAHGQHPHAQTMHPAAAAAMFTPLSLRTFITAPSAHSHLGLAAAAAAAAQQPLTPTSAAVASHYHHTHQQQHQPAQHYNQHTSPPPPPLPPANAVTSQTQSQLAAMNINVGVVAAAMRQSNSGNVLMPLKKKMAINDAEASSDHHYYQYQMVLLQTDRDKLKLAANPEKRKAEENDLSKDLKKAKLETKALKAKRPGFTDERYHETSYYIENGLRKVYPYYFTFTTFTKGRWVGEKILDVFAREFRAHPAEEYERCIKAGTLTVNYEKVPTDYRLKHNDLLANVVHRHETPVLAHPIKIVYIDSELVVLDKPCSIPVHPCGRYRHNTVVFILAKEYNLKNLRTIHRLDRLTSGLLLFGRSPKKARQMEHQIRNRQVRKEYICRVDGEFPDGIIECKEPIEVVSYKIGVCKVSPKGKECTTSFQKLGFNGKTSVVLCKPLTGRMHQIRVHLQYLGYPVVNDPLYNHEVFGPNKGRGGDIGGKSDEQLVKDLINIHNAENWLGIDGDSELSLFKSIRSDTDDSLGGCVKGNTISDDESESVSRESSPCSESPRPVSIRSESPHDSSIHQSNNTTTPTGATNNNCHHNNHQNNNQIQSKIITSVTNNVSTIIPTTPSSTVVTNNNNSTSNVGTLTSGTNSLTSSINHQHQQTTTINNIGIQNNNNCYNQNLNILALQSKVKVTVATQTGHESPDLTFNSEKMTTDKHCYECKVRYRDPKPQDLVMYLHAWKYKGPGWEYETDLPNWAKIDWIDPTFE